MPALAQGGKEETLFQIAGDSITEIKTGSGQPQKVEWFRNLSKMIETWDDTSQTAKSKSLRGDRGKLAGQKGTELK